ncbi:MAG: copper resistance protein CopC/CopD [Tagaea sp.]|nr:copper resistance protein CopC/CopD [Tagaea sp.]
MRAALFALVLALWAGSAAAHAVLLETDPADGARLSAAPAAVVLRFNESVAPVSARLVTASGAAIELAPVARGTEIEIPLPAALAAGGHYVVWRVASADTHPIAGTLAFSVGGADPPAPDVVPPDDAWRIAAILARALRDLTLALGVGGAAFLALMGARRGRAVYAGLALAAFATLADVNFAGARLAEAAPWTPSAWRAGWTSSAGDGARAILIGLAFAALPGRLGPWIGLVSIGAGTALTGHAATASPRWLFGGAQALHVSAAIFWLGAFLPLLRELRRAPTRAAEWGAKFSPFGIAAVVSLTLAALVLTIGHAADISVEFASLLAAKAVSLGALVFVAAENRNDAVPGILARKPGAPARFARYLAIEMALGSIVLALAATLAHTPPSATMAHAVARAPGADLSLVAFRDGRMLAIERAGTRLELRVSDTAGKPIDANELEVELSGGNVEALRRRPARRGPGHYALDEPALALPGPWRLRVETLIDDFTKLEFETELRGR